MTDRPRRKRGTGTVEQMRDGTFRARLPGDGDRLRSCSTYEEAEQILDAALVHLRSGAREVPQGMTLRAFGVGFLERRKVTHANAADDVSTWNSCVLSSFLADRPLSSIDTYDVREFRDKTLARKAKRGNDHKRAPGRTISRSRAANALNLLRVALREAVERGLIKSNPAEGVKMPRAMGVTHEPWTYLTQEEQEALLTCPEIPEDDRALYTFVLGTGMRESEVWNLHLRDLRGVRLVDGVVHFDRTAAVVVRYGGHGKSTKGKRIRYVPIFGLTRDALSYWLPILATRPNPSSLVWPLSRGERRGDGSMPRHWYKHLGAAGIVTICKDPSSPVEAADCTAEHRHDGLVPVFHALRHTCASSLVAGWWGRRWSLQEVREILGHRSVTTTERYAHLAESAIQQAAWATDLSTISPQQPDASEVSARNHSAPPRRLERPTNGLGIRLFQSILTEVSPQSQPRWGDRGAIEPEVIEDVGTRKVGRR